MPSVISRPRGPRKLRPDRGDGAEGDPHPGPPARQGQGQYRRTQRRGCVCPADRRHVPGVDSDDRQVTLHVHSLDRAGCRRPSAKVTETSSPRRLWALVSDRPGCEHDAGPPTLRPPNADDGAAGDVQDPPGGNSEFIE